MEIYVFLFFLPFSPCDSSCRRRLTHFGPFISFSINFLFVLPRVQRQQWQKHTRKKNSFFSLFSHFLIQHKSLTFTLSLHREWKQEEAIDRECRNNNNNRSQTPFLLNAGCQAPNGSVHTKNATVAAASTHTHTSHSLQAENALEK